MLGLKDMAAVERRAAAARLTIGELCERAEVAPSTWSRAKARKGIRVSTMRRLENALDQIERSTEVVA